MIQRDDFETRMVVTRTHRIQLDILRLLCAQVQAHIAHAEQQGLSARHVGGLCEALQALKAAQGGKIELEVKP